MSPQLIAVVPRRQRLGVDAAPAPLLPAPTTRQLCYADVNPGSVSPFSGLVANCQDVSREIASAVEVFRDSVWLVKQHRATGAHT
jgi:hypothetical protein